MCLTSSLAKTIRLKTRYKPAAPRPRSRGVGGFLGGGGGPRAVWGVCAEPGGGRGPAPAISPKEAITVPPGTPGAPMANTASSTQNSSMVPGLGSSP